jgi:hypothetical protein
MIYAGKGSFWPMQRTNSHRLAEMIIALQNNTVHLQNNTLHQCTSRDFAKFFAELGYFNVSQSVASSSADSPLFFLEVTSTSTSE